MYKCYTSVLREGIIPTAYDKLPDFNRGFISEGSCAQAELALLTLIERELRERSVLFCCMVDITKAFSLVRRHFSRMQRACRPVYLIRTVVALYEETRATVRIVGGFSPSFLIEQGTRERYLLSPLLFLIFFPDAVRHICKIRILRLVFLGALVAVTIFSLPIGKRFYYMQKNIFITRIEEERELTKKWHASKGG